MYDLYQRVAERESKSVSGDLSNSKAQKPGIATYHYKWDQENGMEVFTKQEG